MNYMDIANHYGLFIVASIIILFVLAQTIWFMSKAWQRALSLGVSRETLISTIKTSISISILPSIPIVLAIFVLVPLLGIAAPWLRLTVIGSAPFEMLAADMGAKAVGAESLGGAGFDETAFAAALLLMTIGGSLPLFLCVLFNKRISLTYEKFRERDANWMLVLSGAALMALIVTLMIEYLGQGLISALTVITSSLFALTLSVLGQRAQLSWLKNFTLPLSMMLGMVCAIFYTNILS